MSRTGTQTVNVNYGPWNTTYKINLGDRLDLIKKAEDEGEPFDLVITDMHYPLSPMGKDHYVFIKEYEDTRNFRLLMVFRFK